MVRERRARLACLLLLHSAPALVSCASASACTDEDSHCKQWQQMGECENNPGFMHLTCALTCGTCAKQRARGRRHECNDIGADAHVEGDVTAIMERLEQRTELGPEVLSRDPWVMRLNTFLTEAEAAEVVRVGGHHFEQSLAGYGNGVVSARTSSTSWCNVPVCEEDAVMRSLKAKIVGCLDAGRGKLPQVNTEHLQVLKYQSGQFYKQHHDQNSPIDAPYGPRVFTFFTYLSNVTSGGGTKFHRLNLTVTPKVGSAILWPSVRDDDVYVDDMRTEHEALPVASGLKYAANFWTHLRDFQTPHKFGCTSPQPAATSRRMLHENARANGELLRPPYSTATVRRAPYGVVAATGDEEEEGFPDEL